MADYKVTDTELTSIANAIRTKGGTQAQLEFPTGFVSAVNAIPTGGGGVDFKGVFSVGSSSVSLELIKNRVATNSGNFSYGCIWFSPAFMAEIDPSKNFEFGCAFKLKDTDKNFTLFGEIGSSSAWSGFPSMEVDTNLVLGRGYTLQSGTNTSWTDFSTVKTGLSLDTWYFGRMRFESATMKLISEVTTDFVNYDSLETVIAEPVKFVRNINNAGFGFGSFSIENTNRSKTALIDLYNTYIKKEGSIVFGAFTGQFPEDA